MSSNDENDSSSSSSSEALTATKKKSKKNKKQQTEENKHQEIEQNIENLVKLFLDLRFEHTNIHPTEDPAIIYLCRVFKHFLLKDRKLYYNRMLQTLSETYEVPSTCIAKLRKLFNAIPSRVFEYLVKSNVNKEKRKLSRIWYLNKNDLDYEFSLKQVQRMRNLFKYGALQYNHKDKNSVEKNKKWKWIGDGIDDNKENITTYSSISNGFDVFYVNDIVQVKSDLNIQMRPWIARIIQLLDDNGEKKVMLRWFWFWNQILNDFGHGDKNEIKVLEKNAGYVLGENVGYPPRACDVFECVVNDETNIDEEPVEIMFKVVHLTCNGLSAKYMELLDGVNVFECNYFFDSNKKKFIKKKAKELSDDQRRLIKKYNKNNNNMDINDDDDDKENEMNNKMEMDEDDDLDLDIGDIEGDNNIGFTVRDDKKKEKGKEKENESDLSEIQSDKSLDDDTL